MLRRFIIPIIIMFAMSILPVFAELTPPIMPKIEETPLPPPIELGTPESIQSDVPMKPISADEAASIALTHQPTIEIARSIVKAAQGREQQARAGLIPTIGISSSYNSVNGGSGGASIGSVSGSSGYQASASIRQLLFDFDRTRNLSRQASAQRRSTNASLSSAESDLVLRVKQAFYTYSQNQRLVAVNEANLKNRQDHLALAKARLNAGVGLPVDVVRAETSVSEAVLNLNLAYANASASKVALVQLMGIDPRTPITIADAGEPEIAADDMNALVETALKQRPEMEQSRAGINAAQYGLSAARTNNSPALVGSLSYGGRGATLPLDNSTTLGVSIQFNLFDGGVTAGKIKEAQANLQGAQSQLTSVQYAVISDVTQAYLNLKSAEQRVATADSEVKNAEEALRLAQGRYNSGLGTFLDVLDAQTALLTANTNRVNTQSAVNQTRSAMERALGQPIHI